ncbi:copper amine oxidase [Aspergillus indologenus CBS 114.80]|uniref:Amine oxidase n=1 Tax=Aspergillus indologenus CBS 114.80 TaxID=1450541 RepID=A0A2V5HUE7_9EURO|nr:copper amine oxidase [Aspergillus indologenus CBS 114.80]
MAVRILRRLWVSTLLTVLALLITVFFFLSDGQVFSVPRLTFGTSPTLTPTGTLSALPIAAPRPNPWKDLSEQEVIDVLRYVHTVPLSLNLTPAVNATLRDNFVQGIQLARPPKTSAQAFVQGTTQQPPPRHARVAIHHGSSDEVYWDEYLIGPLPVGQSTTLQPAQYPHRHDLDHARNLVPDALSFKQWPYSVAREVADITQDLLGSTINDGRRQLDPDDDGLELSFRDPWVEEGHILRWCSFQRAGTRAEAGTLLPQGLYVMLDTTTRNPDNWKVLHWYYNGRLYNSTDEFRAAWRSPAFERLRPNQDGAWTTIEDFSNQEPGREKPSPVMVQPEGPRYRIDRKQQYVSWMGFTFYWAFAQATGITLFDVRFRGEPILYELGLQEAIAQYAGSDPMQGAVAYLDSFFGMGRAMFELVPGYDCPTYADFLDTMIYDAERSQRRRNTICLFEYTADYPLQRHTTSFYVTVSRNNYLVLRTTAVVGNYDYTVDYVFYLDGTIEVKVRASGYIQGAYYHTGESERYGYRVHDQFATSMHDHVINFKADMDVLGSNNTLMKVTVEPQDRGFPWTEGEMRHTMSLNRTPVDTECGLNWTTNSQSMYVVLDTQSRNAWGEMRGYRIMPGSGIGTPAHLTFNGSKSLGKAASWALSDLWVTKQKDDEERSASPRNAFNTDRPMVDFSQYLNGEHIEQQDLVIWFNLGNHHVPHSGDIPNTLQHTSASSVIFSPFNFHDRDASRASAQGVRLELPVSNHGDTPSASYFGHHRLEGMTLRQVRKFPYTEDMLAM